jgi:hypothetical protein
MAQHLAFATRLFGQGQPEETFESRRGFFRARPADG